MQFKRVAATEGAPSVRRTAHVPSCSVRRLMRTCDDMPSSFLPRPLPSDQPIFCIILNAKEPLPAGSEGGQPHGWARGGRTSGSSRLRQRPHRNALLSAHSLFCVSGRTIPNDILARDAQQQANRSSRWRGIGTKSQMVQRHPFTSLVRPRRLPENLTAYAFYAHRARPAHSGTCLTTRTAPRGARQRRGGLDIRLPRYAALVGSAGDLQPPAATGGRCSHLRRRLALPPFRPCTRTAC